MPKSLESSSSGSLDSGEDVSSPQETSRDEAAAKPKEQLVEVEVEDSEPCSDKKKHKGKRAAKETKVSSSSDSGSSEEVNAIAKKHKSSKIKKADKAKKGKKSKDNKKDKKEKNKKERDKKKKKKKGKDSKKAKMNRDAVSNQFGKYGVIKPEDFFNKKAEFLLWAMEVQKVNTDAMGQMQMKDLFKDYIEDYNTATMPSKKYYNLQVWDRLQTSKRSKKVRGDDMTEAQKAALASFDDERARKEEIRHLQAKKQESQVKDEVRKMRQDASKVEEMKHQERLRVQMGMLNKAGHTKEASKIAGRLDPNKDEFGRPLSMHPDT